jgi:hypothetical protein
VHDDIRTGPGKLPEFGPSIVIARRLMPACGLEIAQRSFGPTVSGVCYILQCGRLNQWKCTQPQSMSCWQMLNRQGLPNLGGTRQDLSSTRKTRLMCCHSLTTKVFRWAESGFDWACKWVVDLGAPSLASPDVAPGADATLQDL